MATEWSVHYPGWVIEDGGPDREVGAVFDWSEIEFWTDEPLARGDVRSKTAIPIGDSKYKIAGEVASLTAEGCLVDFGLKALGNHTDLASGCKEGEYVIGKISIGFAYGIIYRPATIYKTLKYRWHVNRISADLTPFISHPDNPRLFFRDEARIHCVDIESTRDVKAMDYVLYCTEVR